MVMLDKNKHPETLLVLRDGYIDDEYYDAIWAQKRREAFEACVSTAVATVTELATRVPRNVGREVLSLLSNSTLHVN